MPNRIQMTCVLIPGKNWKLSLAEVIVFLKSKGIKFEVNQLSREFVAFTTKERTNAITIDDLGGTLKIGKTNSEFNTQVVKKAFLQKDKLAQAQIAKSATSGCVISEMLEASFGKIRFGVSVYCSENSLRPVSGRLQRFLGSTIKRELSSHDRNSSFIGFAKKRKQPQLTPVEVLKKDFVGNKAEILFCIGTKHTIVATTTAVHNPFEFQKRDVKKPVQRKIFAMPPRLSKIMVNLASCSTGKLLLDPFCGVGTILQEALLVGARVIGLDINPWCIKATTKNLEWIKKEYTLKDAEYTVVQGDARRITDKIGGEVDCIASEPDLGPALRQVPTAPYAERIVRRLKPIYHDFLQEAYKALKKDGRLVLVAPYLRTRSGKPVTMPIEERAIDIGFRRVYPFQENVFNEDIEVKANMGKMSSFVDYQKRHKVGREIHIFQK